jgi:TonB family protein
MTVTRFTRRIAVTLAALLLCQSAFAVAQDTLVRAKELYLAASYDEALTLLERLQFEATGTAATEVAEYKAFCLIALDRASEARTVIQGIVNLDPFYRPSEVEASPRVRGVFQEVRKPLLPVVVQRLYTEAKASFDRKDPQSAVQFERVITLLDDPDLKDSPLADLKTLASGFRDLSKASAAAASAATPARPAPPVQTTASAATVPVSSMSPAVAPAAAQTVSMATAPAQSFAAARDGDPGVTPPVTIAQPLPPWAPSKLADRQGDFKGSLEVTIDEQGYVENVVITKSVHPLYDPELLRVARSWRFKPAMKGGLPVLYLKVVEVHLLPKK